MCAQEQTCQSIRDYWKSINSHGIELSYLMPHLHCQMHCMSLRTIKMIRSDGYDAAFTHIRKIKICLDIFHYSFSGRRDSLSAAEFFDLTTNCLYYNHRNSSCLVFINKSSNILLFISSNQTASYFSLIKKCCNS